MGPTLVSYLPGVGAAGARTSAVVAVGMAWMALGGGEEGLTRGL